MTAQRPRSWPRLSRRWRRRIYAALAFLALLYVIASGDALAAGRIGFWLGIWRMVKALLWFALALRRAGWIR